MKPNPAAEEIPPPIKAVGDTQFTSRVSKARHDLHNSIGHIVGFSEMWVEEFREQNSELLQREMQGIFQAACEMTAQINEGFNVAKFEAGLIDLASVERQICGRASQIVATAEILARHPQA